VNTNPVFAALGLKPSPIDYQAIISDAERKYGLAPGLLNAIQQQESGGSTDLGLQGVPTRHGRAQGPFQIMPSIWGPLPDTFEGQADLAARILSQGGGTPAAQLASYYGRGQAQIGFPTTDQYVAQVLSRLSSTGKPAQESNPVSAALAQSPGPAEGGPVLNPPGAEGPGSGSPKAIPLPGLLAAETNPVSRETNAPPADTGGFSLISSAQAAETSPVADPVFQALGMPGPASIPETPREPAAAPETPPAPTDPVFAALQQPTPAPEATPSPSVLDSLKAAVEPAVGTLETLGNLAIKQPAQAVLGALGGLYGMGKYAFGYGNLDTPTQEQQRFESILNTPALEPQTATGKSQEQAINKALGWLGQQTGKVGEAVGGAVESATGSPAAGAAVGAGTAGLLDLAPAAVGFGLGSKLLGAAGERLSGALDATAGRVAAPIRPSASGPAAQMEKIRPLQEAPSRPPEAPAAVGPTGVAHPTSEAPSAAPVGIPAEVVNMNLGITPDDIMRAGRQLQGQLAETDLGRRAGEYFSAVTRDLQMKVAPMAVGSDRAIVAVKDFANTLRKTQWQWGQISEMLNKEYTPAQNKDMWRAGEEENTLRRTGVQNPDLGIARLSVPQIKVMEQLHRYSEEILQRARDVGTFEGEGVDFWVPRMVVNIGEDGTFARVKGSSGGGKGAGPYPEEGRNIVTSAPSLKHRKYATAAETEAAAKARFGEGAQVVQDLRALPIALARVERAIAGRELINRIKDMGDKTGQTLVSESPGEGLVPVNHPAFKTWRPRFIKNAEGKMVPAIDQNGDTIFDPVPLYVSKEVEGPLKSIMSQPSGKIYSDMMALKGRATGLIMYSPLIHNAVEWGRALPLMPGKVATGRIYFEGGAARRDPVLMREAIDAGLVPIGHRFQFQDITGLQEMPGLQPGRGWTSKAAGWAAGKISSEAGQAVSRAIDKAGDIWHNKLLWDVVARLQMGIYKNVRDDMLAKGEPPTVATHLAAHFANRYAGALPNEAMSVAARKWSNILLFSRTFTLGNLGVFKDMLTGLPKDVKAQIERDGGSVARQIATSAARKKAWMAFSADVALFYASNALLQNATDKLVNDKSLSDIEQGYAKRFHSWMSRVNEDPRELLDFSSVFPQSSNEPGKEERVFVTRMANGTALYARNPAGKLGEEFLGWTTSPLDMFKRKLGTLVRPVWQIATNDKGFGRRVYDPDAPGMKGFLDNAGRVLWTVIGSQGPEDAVRSGYDILTGHGTGMDYGRVLAPLAGFTISHGAPGGPRLGVMFKTEEDYRARVAEEMPAIRELIKRREFPEAVQRMRALSMSTKAIQNQIIYTLHPEARMVDSRIKAFLKKASPEARQEFLNVTGGSYGY
jgi:hypothetical protein